MTKRKFAHPYKRQTGNASYAIVSDGDTEKWYFQLMKDAEKLLSYITCKHFKGNLEETYSRVKEVLNEEYTRLFWIVDLDVIIKEEHEFDGTGIRPLQRLSNIVREANEKYKEQLQIVFNNPCLEYWYLLHYKQTSKYYQKYDGQLKNELSTYIPSYQKTEKFYKDKNIYLMLKDKLPVAIGNAKVLPPFDVAEAEQSCAEIYKVVEYLLETK